jgi:hypothetical protein
MHAYEAVEMPNFWPSVHPASGAGVPVGPGVVLPSGPAVDVDEATEPFWPVVVEGSAVVDPETVVVTPAVVESVVVVVCAATAATANTTEMRAIDAQERRNGIITTVWSVIWTTLAEPTHNDTAKSQHKRLLCDD